MQHVRPGRGDGRRPTRRGRSARSSSSPPIALLVGIPLAIVFVIGALLLFSGGDAPERRATQDAEPAPAAEVETAAPAATAAPKTAPEPVDQSDGMRDSDGDGEETEAEIKERLDAIKRVRAAEQELFGEGSTDDNDREILDETED